MFNDDDWSTLLKKLLELTEDKLVAWISGPGKSFALEVEKFAYVISAADSDGQAPWALSVSQHDGERWQMIDRLVSIGGSDFGSDPRRWIVPLRAIIVRQSTNADAILSDLMSGLRAIESQPPSHPRQDE